MCVLLVYILCIGFLVQDPEQEPEKEQAEEWYEPEKEQAEEW